MYSHRCVPIEPRRVPGGSFWAKFVAAVVFRALSRVVQLPAQPSTASFAIRRFARRERSFRDDDLSYTRRFGGSWPPSVVRWPLLATVHHFMSWRAHGRVVNFQWQLVATCFATRWSLWRESGSYGDELGHHARRCSPVSCGGFTEWSVDCHRRGKQTVTIRRCDVE